MGCGASKEVVEEEIKEERRREKRKRERAEKKSNKKKKKKKKSKKPKKDKNPEPPQTNVHVTLPSSEAPKEPPKETPPAPAPAPAPEPIKIIVEQPAPVQQEPPPVVQQAPVQPPPPPPPVQQPPQQQFEPQYHAVPSTMGVSLEDLGDKICLIEQNIQLQSQTNEQIHRIILAIAANQKRAEVNQMAALPPAQPQLAIQPPPPTQQPQIVQVPVPYQVPVPVQVPATPHEPMMPTSQTDNMTSAVLEQHLAKLKHEQNLLIRDLNRIKRHGHYDPNSFKVRSILSYIENQQKAINQLESAVSAASFAENDFTDFSFPSYSQPVQQPVGRPQTMNYKPTSSGHWNSNAAAALPPVGNTAAPMSYGSMFTQQGNPNVNRMEIKTPQNPQNPGFPGFY